MLVEVYLQSNTIGDLIAKVNGNSFSPTILEKGVYEIGHFNFNLCIENRDSIKEEYPDFKSPPTFNPYGVCDDYTQILKKCPEIKRSKEKKYVISVTPILKANQSPEGGWRWHKWGPYIGTQKPTCEYLYDEPLIEKVYCYHIYEIA